MTGKTQIMTVELKPARIRAAGQRVVHYMEIRNSEGRTFSGLVSEFCMIEIVDTFKKLGIPCALLGKDAGGLYTGVVIAGQTFRVSGEEA